MVCDLGVATCLSDQGRMGGVFEETCLKIVTFSFSSDDAANGM